MSHAVSSWPVVSLFDFCNPKQWPTIPQTAFVEHGYPVYGANGQIGRYTQFNHEKPTVLITCRGATCGTINVCEPKSYVTGNAMALDDLDESRVSAEYLVYALRSGSIARAISGTAQPQITRQSLTAISIPLPPLPEQQRIAEVLHKAEGLRTKRRATLAHLDRLSEILFLDMFGDPATNPKCWLKEQLGHVARFRQGLQVDLAEQFDEDGPDRSRFLRIVNYTQNSDEFRYIAKQPESRHVQPDDIVVVRYGATAGFVGRGQYGVIANNLFTVEVDETVGTRDFVYHLLRQPRIYGLLLEGRKAAAMPAINFSGMEKLPFILPPLDLQREFGRRVVAVDALKTAQRASLAELDALFASLQHRAFKGELW